jgi:hypothetical protein
MQRPNLITSFLCRWVQRQDTTELWIDGARDYVQYAKKLMKDYADVIDADAHATAPVAKRTSPTDAPPPKPLFGGPPPAAGAAAPTFGSTPAAFTGFNFAAAPGAGAFGGAATFTPAAPAGPPEEEEAEAEEAAEPSLLLEAAAGVDILLKEKVHLATPAPPDADKKWIPRGMGLLTIRRAAADDGSNRHYIVFTTESGRVLLNGLIAKQLPAPTQRGKDGNQVVMVLMSNVDGKEENGPKVFRADTADVAKRIVDKVVEVQSQS